MLSKTDLLKTERLYSRYGRHMYNAAYSILNDHFSADDAVQNAVIRVMKNLDKIDEADEKKTVAFLCITARNEAKRLYRANHREVLPDDPENAIEMIASPFDTERIVISNETIQEIRTCINNEKPDYRDTFILHFYKEYTVKETADIMRSKEDTIYKRLQRLRAKIQNNVGKKVLK